MATIPGAKLFHEGQFEARRIRVPVFLGRRPEEPLDEAWQAFYKKLLAATDPPGISRRAMGALQLFRLAG